MLVKYKKALEKRAMGLLSYMPLEKDVKRLMETIQQYEQDDNWLLYLWKIEEEYVGTIGLEVNGAVATVQHIAVLPSHRGEGIARDMLLAIKEMEQFETIQACTETEPFIEKCKDILDDAE